MVFGGGQIKISTPVKSLTESVKLTCPSNFSHPKFVNPKYIIHNCTLLAAAVIMKLL
jgi:hypothetical protein